MPNPSTNPDQVSGRNLIVCYDGTNNQFGPENTNVVRLVQVLDRDPLKQRIYYDPGVGTLPEPGTWDKVSQWLSKVAGLAFGAGINWKVGEAYTYLINTWEPGDRVFLFGFSRGAYTVRVLAGLLFSIGLLPRGCENLVPYALRLYKGFAMNGTVAATLKSGLGCAASFDGPLLSLFCRETKSAISQSISWVFGIRSHRWDGFGIQQSFLTPQITRQ